MTVKPEAVKAAASLVQPYYAVPTQYITMDDFPYTSNGKIDKRALRQLALDKLARIKAEKVAEAILVTKPEFYTASPYDGKLLADIVNVLPQPLPVYQVGMNEKSAGLITVKELGSSTSSSSISESTEKGASVSVLESGNMWDGYLEDELPDKTQGHVFRNIRHQIFSLYRRLFGVIFVVNMGVFISTLVKGGANSHELGLIVVANLFCAILMRQDYVINTFFTIACAVPSRCVFRDSFN